VESIDLERSGQRFDLAGIPAEKPLV
jgi:hypothetical protein